MIDFRKRVLFLGYGAVAQCTLPILLKHFRIPPQNITVMDFEDRSGTLCSLGSTRASASSEQRITPENLGVGAGQAPVGRRSADRSGLEHRLLRDSPVVPRPGRALSEHVGGGVGPVHRRRRKTSHRADALLAAHEHPPHDGRLARSPARPPCWNTAPIPA